MKKLLFAVLFGIILGSLTVRYQAIQFGKKSYLYGCNDASLKLAKLGDIAESVTIENFCKAREDALDNFLGVF